MEKLDFEEIKLTEEEEMINELQMNLARGGASGGWICWCQN